eukprot:gene10417-2944_t
MGVLNLTVINERTNAIFNYEVDQEETIENLKALIEVDSKIKLENQNLKFEGKLLSENQVTLKQVGIKTNELLSLEEKVQPRTQPQIYNNYQTQQPQQQQNYNQNPFGNLDILKTSTKDLINHLRQNQYMLQQFPPQFSQAVLSQNEQLVDKMIEPLKKKFKHDELMKRIQINPFDIEAQKHLEELIQQGNIEENMEKALEHTPESFAKVVMLYIPAKVNNVSVKAFVDSGAQMSIMTKECAEKCGLLRLLDKRWAGMAQGVGTAKILGRIHLTTMTIGKSYFNISITVLEQKGIDFLLGLDMLRRHQCSIDLKKNALEIGDETVSFLQEKDIPDHDTIEVQSPKTHGNISFPTPQQQTQQTLQHDEGKIKTLVGLGFSRDQSIKALDVAKGNVEIAAGILFGN